MLSLNRMPYILNVKVDNVTRREALARIDQLIRDGGQHIITTPNPEIIVAAQRDAAFRDLLNRAALALPDGFGLMLGAWFLGTPLKERIAGSDFVWDIARLAAEKGYTIYLLGGEEGVAQKAAEKLKMKNNKLKIVVAEAGPQYEEARPPSDRRPGLPISNIQSAAPDILLVALGHGKQEKWIAKHLPELPSVKVAMGVGGAFDFIAGRVQRAPAILRLLGLEWLWRLLRQPWRAPRIWRAVVVFPLLMLRAKLQIFQHS